MSEEARLNYMNELPEGLTTPDSVETSLGTLQFSDGVPTQDTADLLYDHLDLYRAVETFLVGMPAASLDGFRRGLASDGVDSSNKALLYDGLMDSKPLFLTGNSSTVYVIAMLDLEKDGPTVIEVPAGTGPGVVNDAFFRNVTDLGPPGPDNGKGGRYVIYPPDYDGGYPRPGITGDWLFPVTSPTSVNLVILRGFIIDNGVETSNKIYREGFKIYPLAEASQPWQAEGTKGNPPPMEFISGTGLDLNTIHSNDFHFFEELHTVIDREPVEMIDPEMRGLFASIGIQKGKPFDPDDRMKRILTDAIKVANGTARCLLWYEREKSEFIYEGSYWKRGYVGDDWQYLKDDGMGGRNLDARTHFFYNATVNSPAMSNHLVHAGSQYAWGYRVSDGGILDGGRLSRVLRGRDAVGTPGHRRDRLDEQDGPLPEARSDGRRGAPARGNAPDVEGEPRCLTPGGTLFSISHRGIPAFIPGRAPSREWREDDSALRAHGPLARRTGRQRKRRRSC